MATETTNCQRCGRACIGRDGNPEARIMRRTRRGVCVDCSVVVFLQQLGNTYTQLLPPGYTMQEAIKLPHIQEQFAAVMKAGQADARPDEINWERVVELWDIAPTEEGVLW